MLDLKLETVWYNDFVEKELPKKVDSNKVFVITGTTSGTGFVAARTVAKLGGEVVLLNRPSDRAAKALAQLKDEVPEGEFVTVDCDLQNFESVRKAAASLKDKYNDGGIYAVCWNAGIMATPDRATVDGYDEQMQTNHLSHFLLTAELYPLLEAYAAENGDARIVNHSSGARHMTPKGCLERKYFEKNGGNLGGSEKPTGFGGPCYERYSQTKLANAVFTKALHQRLKAKKSKVRAICADPGISATNLADHLDGIDHSKMVEKMQTQEDGAMGIIKAMVDPDAQSGLHYGPAGSKGPAVPNEEKPYETNPANMEMLWETSEAATGITFKI